MTRAAYGLILAVLFAIMCYVGPSEAGTINLTAADCAAGGCYR
jgi:hypothetical protein